MKVLFITHVTDMAGANRSMFQLITELMENYQVEPVVLVPEVEDSKNGILEVLEKSNIPVITTEIRIFKREHPTFRNIIGYARYLWKQRQLYKRL